MGEFDRENETWLGAAKAVTELPGHLRKTKLKFSLYIACKEFNQSINQISIAPMRSEL